MDDSPRSKFTYMHDTPAVANEKINRIFRGTTDYYKLTDNDRHFGCRLFYIFSHSLAKMYAAKYR
jgi:Type II intron maturase